MTAQASRLPPGAATFLDRLKASGITYTLQHVRDALMVSVAIPGERWEVEFFDDGRVEVERFESTGEIEGEAALATLFDRPEAP